MNRPGAAFEPRNDPSLDEDRLAGLRAGLQERPMRLSPVWFYDERGSALFERICELPEYYPTRTELAIMQQHAGAIAAMLGPRVALIEPGSGASRKTRLLIEALEQPAAYVPVDISREHLLASARRLKRTYPRLDIHPLCADFTGAFRVPAPALRQARRRVVYFPGSTIGNFPRREAVGLLARLRSIAGEDGAVVLGIDRVKPAAVLERAYNDAAGVTADFNLNVLRHLNREAGTDFDLRGFAHRAPWVAAERRIEMHLVALRDQAFRLDGESFGLSRGEYLLTEYSHKYSLEDAEAMAAEAGLALRQAWSDPAGWFSVLLLG
jgi:dimethylhistidine N-methyltransferase